MQKLFLNECFSLPFLALSLSLSSLSLPPSLSHFPFCFLPRAAPDEGQIYFTGITRVFLSGFARNIDADAWRARLVFETPEPYLIELPVWTRYANPIVSVGECSRRRDKLLVNGRGEAACSSIVWSRRVRFGCWNSEPPEEKLKHVATREASLPETSQPLLASVNVSTFRV